MKNEILTFKVSELLKSIQHIRVAEMYWGVDNQTRHMNNVEWNQFDALTKARNSFDDVIVVNWSISVIPPFR